MNIMRIFKNILTAATLVIMAAGLSSCYFKISDEAKKQIKYSTRHQMYDAEWEVDTVTCNPNAGTLSVTSTGSGNATISGKADSVTPNNSGSGDIVGAGELKAKTVTTQGTGIGKD